jgi:DNA polymerase III delta prime subunit
MQGLEKAREFALVPEHVREVMRGLCAGEGDWPLYLYGPPGTGKTLAALCLHDHCGGIFYEAAQFHVDAVAAMKGDLMWPWMGPDRSDIREGIFWETMAKTRLLTIDDVGTRGRVTDAAYDRLKRAIDSRLGKPMIVTSNLDLEALSKVYDDRLASRLAGGTLVQVAGDDRRIK